MDRVQSRERKGKGKITKKSLAMKESLKSNFFTMNKNNPNKTLKGSN